MICKPWEDTDKLQDKEHSWIIQYLLDRDIPVSYLKKPKNEEQEKQIEYLCKYLSGSRNFILLTCKNSAYIKELYYILAGVWLMTAGSGFEIISPLDIVPNSPEFGDKLARLKEVDLLIVPYVDPADYNLRKTKTAMGNIMSSRKARKKATITDVFVRGEFTEHKLSEAVEGLGAVFGEHCIPMFLEKDSNSKIVKIRR